MSQVPRKVYTVWADGTVENLACCGTRAIANSNEKLENARNSGPDTSVDIRGIRFGYENFISHSSGAKWRRFATLALIVWACAATAMAITRGITISELQATITQQDQVDETRE